MSLTSQLSKVDSPVSIWIEAHTDRKAISKIVKETNDYLCHYPPLVVAGTHHLSTIGTAFDYAFRWLIGSLSPDVARIGTELAEESYGWIDATKLIDMILEDGNRASQISETRARCTVVLAWFEQVFRMKDLHSVLKDLKDKTGSRETLEILYSLVPLSAIEDVYQLLESASKVWANDLNGSFVLNPTFSGSIIVGGADADWIANDTIYECKCSRVIRPFGRQHLLQLVGYVLLNYDDKITQRELPLKNKLVKWNVNAVGWYYARHQIKFIYQLDQFLLTLFGTANFVDLQRDFVQSIIAANTEAERRRNQLQLPNKQLTLTSGKSELFL